MIALWNRAGDDVAQEPLQQHEWRLGEWTKKDGLGWLYRTDHCMHCLLKRHFVKYRPGGKPELLHYQNCSEAGPCYGKR
jgi:hypothetical protein